MKKRLLSIMLISVMAASMVACGKKADEDKTITSTEEATATEEKAIDDTLAFTAGDYVTLGEYDGIEVTLDGDFEVTDEIIEEYVYDIISIQPFVADEDEKEVKEDSIVNVDFVGSQDGVAFAGGSAEDVTIDVANNCEATTGSGYIPGFIDGIVGHEVGEEVACDVTFPEQYGNSDLAGQQVVFTFKINYIARAIEVDELTDEMASELYGMESVEAMKEQAKESAEEELKASYESAVQSAVMETIVAGSTVNSVPENVMQARMDSYISTLESNYCEAGQTLKDYFEENGEDYEEYYSELSDMIQSSLEQEIIFMAVADELSIVIDEAEFEEYINSLLSAYGLESAEDFYVVYDIEGYSGELYVRDMYRINKAIDYCVEHAVVNVAE